MDSGTLFADINRRQLKLCRADCISHGRVCRICAFIDRAKNAEPNLRGSTRTLGRSIRKKYREKIRFQCTLSLTTVEVSRTTMVGNADPSRGPVRSRAFP